MATLEENIVRLESTKKEIKNILEAKTDISISDDATIDTYPSIIEDNLFDVSGVTATASDVLKGKVIVDANGNELTGTMANLGSKLTISSNSDIKTDEDKGEVYFKLKSGYLKTDYSQGNPTTAPFNTYPYLVVPSDFLSVSAAAKSETIQIDMSSNGTWAGGVSSTDFSDSDTYYPFQNKGYYMGPSYSHRDTLIGYFVRFYSLENPQQAIKIDGSGIGTTYFNELYGGNLGENGATLLNLFHSMGSSVYTTKIYVNLTGGIVNMRWERTWSSTQISIKGTPMLEVTILYL